MKLTARVPVTAGLMAMLLTSAIGCQHLEANDQINKGVAAFKNARYEEAEGHFQKAISIDPDNPNPRLYLATTYASQVVPNLDTPDNKKVAQQALAGFQEVLQKDPNNINALKQIASIDRNTGHPEEAKDYEKKVIALDPTDAEALYTVGRRRLDPGVQERGDHAAGRESYRQERWQLQALERWMRQAGKPEHASGNRRGTATCTRPSM